MPARAAEAELEAWRGLDRAASASRARITGGLGPTRRARLAFCDQRSGCRRCRAHPKSSRSAAADSPPSPERCRADCSSAAGARRCCMNHLRQIHPAWPISEALHPTIADSDMCPSHNLLLRQVSDNVAPFPRTLHWRSPALCSTVAAGRREGPATGWRGRVRTDPVDDRPGLGNRADGWPAAAGSPGHASAGPGGNDPPRQQLAEKEVGQVATDDRRHRSSRARIWSKRPGDKEKVEDLNRCRGGVIKYQLSVVK